MSRREGQWELFALSSLCVNAEESVATPVVEEPDENNVSSFTVCGGNDATVIAGGGGYAVMKESVAERLGSVSHGLSVLKPIIMTSPRFRAIEDASAGRFLLILPALGQKVKYVSPGLQKQ